MVPLGGVAWPKWTPELAVEVMDQNGVDKSILTLSEPGVFFGDVPLARELARIVNDYCARVVSDRPDRFGALGVVPLPDMDNALKEVEYVLDTLKLDGITMLSNLAGTYIGDPSFDPLFAELNRRKAVVLVHPTTPKEQLPNVKLPPFFLEFMFDATRAIANAVFTGVFERFPDIRFIFTHVGGTAPYLGARFEYTRARVTAKFPGLEKSTPKGIYPYLNKLYFDTASSYGPGTLACVGHVPGYKHILYGTDWPYAPDPWVGLTTKSLDDFFGSNPALDDIKSANALELFPSCKGKAAAV
jgi:predicted TIM-barrel fold metal-dependent hydrolase